ncbi:MAG: AAA family ATPase [Clostridia bacterium]|nr:AAA family ATPase [Clostridia bacterium]
MKKEVLLDAANEEILKEAEEIMGVPDLKENLRRIVMYSKMKHKKILEDGNLNILIRNNSREKPYEKIIKLIAKLYCKNKIICDESYETISEKDIQRENKKKNRKEELKKASILVFGEDSLNLGFWGEDSKEKVESIMKEYQDKIFIMIDNSYREGMLDAAYIDKFMWRIAIEEMTEDDKKKYIENTLKKYDLSASEVLINKMKKLKFWKIQRTINEAIIDCKIKKIQNIPEDYIDKKKKDKKYEKNKYKNGIEELNSLIGIKEVKAQVQKIINFIKVNKERKNMPMLHMCFTGNPGTGKTTVARIISRIFAEEKIISNNPTFVEAQRSDLIAKYVGWTAIQTKEKIEEALGGVLFIDEAYTLASDTGHGYGDECIATLIKEMEDKRDNLCVILAGYTKEMQQLFEANSGFKSRIQFNIEFPNYTAEELYEIFKKMCKDEKYKLSSNVKEPLIELFEEARDQDNFSNGRFVRNLFEKIKFEQASRAVNKNEDTSLIKKADVECALNQAEYSFQKHSKKIGFAIS